MITREIIADPDMLTFLETCDEGAGCTSAITRSK